MSLAPRNLPNLQSSLQVFINRPLSYELQTGIVSPLFTVVETKAERLPACLRSQEELVAESRRALGFSDSSRGLTPPSASATSCSCRFLYHRDLATQDSALGLYSGVECSAAETRLVDLMVSSRTTRDADSGSRR